VKEVLAYINKHPTLADEVIEEVGPELLYLVSAAVYRPLSRYGLRAGKIYGNPQSKERFKILDIAGNFVYYKNLQTEKTFTLPVDELLDGWNERNFAEITAWDEILGTIQKYLTPLLGGVLTTGLVTWLLRKLK
jgi:hypothetical protein